MTVLWNDVLHVLIRLLEERGAAVRDMIGVISALGAIGVGSLAAWQAREFLTARRVGNRQQAHDALIAALVCIGLSIELTIAALLGLL